MKNIFTKMSSKVYIGALALFLAFGLTSQAGASSVAWAGPTEFGTIANVTGTSIVESSPYTPFSYANTSYASAGDKVAVIVYFHNKGDAPSSNTYIKVNKSTNGSASTFTFTGSVSGGGASKSGSTTVNLSSNQTLTYIPGSLRVSKDRAPVGYAVSNDTDIFSGAGLNIGTVQGMDTCGTDALCHQGSVALGFQVSSTSTTHLCSNNQDDDGDGLIDMNDPGCTDPTDDNEYNLVSPLVCTINSFTGSPLTVASGGYTNLSWNTTNCTTVTVDGVTYPVDGSGNFGPLFVGKTYYLSASNGTSTDSETVYIGVNTVASACTIDTYYASPTTVTSGAYTTIHWNTSNCTTVTIDGMAQSVDGTNSFGPIYSGKTYHIVASNGTSTDSDSLYVGTNSVNNCSIDTFYASPSTVSSGNYTTLYWNTSNCDQVTIDGITYYSVDGSGSFGPLYSGRNYQIQAWKNGQSPVSDTTYVSVDTYSSNNCSIDSFYASPTTVISGATTQLYWNTSNCDQVTVDGINYGVDGNGYFGPLYSGRNYVLNAWKTGQTVRTQTVYVGVNAVNNSYACNDGYDNDGDGRVDYPNDAGCYSVTDNDEYNYIAPVILNTVITTLNPSNLTSSSARMNGTVFNGGNNATQFYFEWGTDSNSLINKTNSQTTLSDSSVTYFDTAYNLSTGVTYYYRAVAQKSNGVILRGDIRQFRLVEAPTPVFTNTVTRVVTVPAPAPERGVVVGLGTNLVQLRYISNDVISANTGGFGVTQTGINQNLNNGVQNVCVDDTIKFVVEYRNISTITLNNAILHIDIPKDVEFRSSSSGVFNKADNTITINVGTLIPGQSGQVSFDGVVMSSASNRDLLVVPATLSFENPNNGARETAIAYGLATTQNCVRNGNLAGFAFGSGFFPDTLFGWLLLILVILTLIYLLRRMFVVYGIAPRTKTAQRHYEDLDIPTAPYSHH